MTPSRIVRLAILESYGVAWSLETFARDVLQNFFDANVDYRDVVTTADAKRAALEIRAPAEFDIDLLAYLGATTKHDGKSAGGFGEGFKVCALVALRDLGLTLHAGSGEHALEAFFDPVPLGRELCYRVTPQPGGRGSFVRLEGCSPEVLAAFASARHCFLHDDNPRIGPLLAASEDGSVAVYASTLGGRGELYYRRQQRGSFRCWAGGLSEALTLACNVPIDALEGDRDRRDLRPDALAEAVGERLPAPALHGVFLALSTYWRYGHAVLGGLLAAAGKRELVFAWPPGWLARVAGGRDEGLAAMAERQGFKLALSAFGPLGMPTVAERYAHDLETRAPTAIEASRIEVCADLYATLLHADRPKKPFEVFDSENAAVLGQHLGSKVIVASKLLLPETFSGAASTVLHEVAHEKGGEDSAAFQHRLARLLAAAFQQQPAIARARARYAAARPVRPVPKPPEAIAAFEPGGDDDIEALRSSDLYVVAYVPPAFPPTAALCARLHEAAARAGVGIYVKTMPIASAREAKAAKVPGLPTFTAPRDDLFPTDAKPGYRLRTYGPEASLLPGVEALGAALLAAEKASRKRAPVTPVTPAAVSLARSAINHAVEWRLFTWAGVGEQRGLDRGWPVGKHAACKSRIAAHADDAVVTEDELYKRVIAEVMEGVVASRALRAADATFDPGDELDAGAMSAAQGACVAGFARGGAARGEADFRAVRAIAAEVFAIELSNGIRQGVLLWALGQAGLDLFHYEPEGAVDAAKLRTAFDRAKIEAVRYQRELDDEAGYASVRDLHARLDHMDDDPTERAIARAQAEKDGARKALRDRVAANRHAEKTLAVKRAYDDELAATGSEMAAAQRCLEEAGRLLGAR